MVCASCLTLWRQALSKAFLQGFCSASPALPRLSGAQLPALPACSAGVSPTLPHRPSHPLAFPQSTGGLCVWDGVGAWRKHLSLRAPGLILSDTSLASQAGWPACPQSLAGGEQGWQCPSAPVGAGAAWQSAGRGVKRAPGAGRKGCPCILAGMAAAAAAAQGQGPLYRQGLPSHEPSFTCTGYFS